jgi:predicted aldo/keto reductase-like oxidoreductase
MDRRDFLRSAAAGATFLGSFPADLSRIERVAGPDKLEQRSLGKTGEKLSIIGFGGIVVKDATPEQASQRVGQAIDKGVNYFDVAPSYGDAEEKLGPALAPYRKSVFLACKTGQRTKNEAAAELERSLQRLRTDHLDLYQLHAVTTTKDVETILGPNGALEAFTAARKAGKTRFLGFSAHSVEAALALMKSFEFDTILFPVNFVTWHAGNFGPQVLAEASRKRMGILALKAMAKEPWLDRQNRTHPKCWYQPLADPQEALKGLRFTLSHPVTAAIPPGDENLFSMALDLAGKFKPLSGAEITALKQQASTMKPIFSYPRAEGS